MARTDDQRRFPNDKLIRSGELLYATSLSHCRCGKRNGCTGYALSQKSNSVVDETGELTNILVAVG